MYMNPNICQPVFNYRCHILGHNLLTDDMKVLFLILPDQPRIDGLGRQKLLRSDATDVSVMPTEKYNPEVLGSFNISQDLLESSSL